MAHAEYYGHDHEMFLAHTPRSRSKAMRHNLWNLSISRTQKPPLRAQVPQEEQQRLPFGPQATRAFPASC